MGDNMGSDVLTERLPPHQQDQLVLYKMANDMKLRRKLCCQLPFEIIDLMKQFLTQHIYNKLKETHEKCGSYAAMRRLIRYATIKKLNVGWSYHLLICIQRLQLNELKYLISPDNGDWEDYKLRNGIPRNSLIDQIRGMLAKFGEILLSPMGRKESGVSSERVPIVHPILCVSEDHFNQNTTHQDGVYRPLPDGILMYEEATQISFHDLIGKTPQTYGPLNQTSSRLQTQHDQYLMLIGPAGSGKTTLTKRIITASISEGKVPFLISFHNLGGSDLWSLRDLIIRFPLLVHSQYEPEEADVEESFQWVLDNEDKCVLVIDGYDQSTFDISSHLITATVYDKLKPEDLLALICSRKFLPRTRLILTSRPHSILKLAPIIRPDVVIFVNDLEDVDMRTLMRHYVTRNDPDRIIETLQIKSPRIARLLNVPLFLRLIAMLSSECGIEIWSYVNTTSKLYYELIERHQDSAHFGSEYRIENLDEMLMKIAYDATIEGRVVIRHTDLRRYNLTAKDVQDLVFAVVEMDFLQNNSSVVGLIIYYFHHQSVQEFLTARQGVEKLSVDEFKLFTLKLFPRLYWGKWDRVERKYKQVDEHEGGMLEVDEDPMMIIRMFTIGCFNQLAHTIDAEVTEKQKYFTQVLCRHIRQLFVKYAAAYSHQMKMMADMMDIRDSLFIQQVKTCLQSFKLQIKFRGLKVGEKSAFFYFLSNFVTNISHLDVDFVPWSSIDIEEFLHIMRRLTGKIEKLQLGIDAENPPQIEDIIGIIPQTSTSLNIWFFGGDGDVSDHLHRQHCRQEFCENMKISLENFDTRQLGTDVLEVEISRKLKAVLRRGETPQIIIRYNSSS